MKKVASLFEVNNCSHAPCFLGVSLKKATYNDIMMLLQSSRWTRDARITHSERWIQWQWSDKVTHLLSQSGALSTWQNASGVTFKENKIWDMNVVFNVSLQDLIAQYGDDFQVYPYAPLAPHAAYAIVYSQFGGGIFTMFTDCNEPHLTPDTAVLSFYYRQGIEQDIKNSLLTSWNGYATRLPDCSAFPPG